MVTYKWQMEYREYVAGLSNRELYEEFQEQVIDHYNDYSSDNRTKFKYDECKTEFEYRLKVNGFLD